MQVISSNDACQIAQSASAKINVAAYEKIVAHSILHFSVGIKELKKTLPI